MTLRFVHLSDIHFGQEKGGTLPQHDDVRAELLSDCTRLVHDGTIKGPATGILLTGDTAHAGKEVEFKKAVGWLEQLTTIIGCHPRAVQVIPGNHDANLDALDATGKLMQSVLRDKSVDDIQAYLNDVADLASNPLMTKLADYRSFAGAFGSDFKSAGQPITIQTHPLEGGRGLRVVGLCSVLISDLNDEPPGRMFLGQNQYIITRSPHHEDIVMVHHPVHWFKDADRAARYIHARARILMTGHEHYPDLTVIEQDNGFQRIHVAAGAVNPPNVTGESIYTYNWIEFNWSSEAGRSVLNVTVYPRRWSPRATQFEPDWGRTRGQLCRTLKLDCGMETSVEASPANPEPGATPEGTAMEAAVREVAVMPVSNPIPTEVSNAAAYELLRFLFWRYLDRPTRQQVLVDLGLLRGSTKPLPTAFERDAFELASREAKLHLLWENTMRYVPKKERKSNPFVSENQ